MTNYHMGDNQNEGKKIDKQFNCDHCGKSYSEAARLQKHIYKVHEGHKDKTYTTCGYCDKSLKGGSYYLNKHIRILHETYKCEYCGEFFPKRKMKIHIHAVHKRKNKDAKISKELYGPSQNIEMKIQENFGNDKVMEVLGEELEQTAQIAIIKHDQNIEIKIQENIGNDKLMEVLESDQIANIIQDQNIEIKIQENIGNNKLSEVALEHEPEPEQIANIKQEKNIEIEIQEYEQNFPFLPVDSHESKMPRDLNNLSQEDEYFCGFCNEVFNQIQNLRNHIKNAHQKTESFRFELSGFPCEMIVKT